MPPVRWKPFLAVSALFLLWMQQATSTKMEKFSMSDDGWRPILGSNKYKENPVHEEITHYRNPASKKAEAVKAEKPTKGTILEGTSRPQATTTSKNNLAQHGHGHGTFPGSKIPPHSKPLSMPQQHGGHGPQIPIGSMMHRPVKYGHVVKMHQQKRHKPIRMQIPAYSTRDEVFVPAPSSNLGPYAFYTPGPPPIKNRGNQQHSDFTNHFALQNQHEDIYQVLRSPIQQYVLPKHPIQNDVHYSFQSQDDFNRNLVPPPFKFTQEDKKNLKPFKPTIEAVAPKPPNNQGVIVPINPPITHQFSSLNPNVQKKKEHGVDIQVTKERFKVYQSTTPAFNQYEQFNYHTVKQHQPQKLVTYEVTEGKWQEAPPFTFHYANPVKHRRPQVPVFTEDSKPFLPTPIKPDTAPPTAATESEVSTIYNQIAKLNRYKEKPTPTAFFDSKDVSTHFPIVGQPDYQAYPTRFSFEAPNEITTKIKEKPSFIYDEVTTKRYRENPNFGYEVTTKPSFVYEITTKPNFVYENPTKASFNYENPTKASFVYENPTKPSFVYEVEADTTTTSTTARPVTAEPTKNTRRRPQQRRRRPTTAKTTTTTEEATEVYEAQKTDASVEEITERPLRGRRPMRYRTTTPSYLEEEYTTRSRHRRPRPTTEVAENHKTAYAEPTAETYTPKDERLMLRPTTEKDFPANFASQFEFNKQDSSEEEIVEYERPNRYYNTPPNRDDKKRYESSSEEDETPTPENEVDFGVISSSAQPTTVNIETTYPAETTTTTTTTTTTMPSTTTSTTTAVPTTISTTEATTVRSHRIRTRPVKYDNSNRPRFSVKEYRQRLTSSTTSTSTTEAPKVPFYPESMRNRFPHRSRRPITTIGHAEPTEESTDAVRPKFVPKDPRHTSNSEGNTEQPVKSTSSRLRTFGRFKSTTEATSTTQRISIKPNIFGTLRRPTPISLKSRIMNKQRSTSTQKPETTTSDDEEDEDSLEETNETDMSEIVESTVPYQIDETTEFGAKVTLDHTEKPPKETDILKNEDFMQSQIVSDLTSSTKNEYNKPGVFKNVSPTSRKVPSYFMLATEDPILPIEAFFPNLKDKQ